MRIIHNAPKKQMYIGDLTGIDVAAPVVNASDFENDSEWAWASYKSVIASYLADPSVRHVCEIGGGRSPLFSPDELKAFDVEYTVLDVSQDELDMAGPEYRKLCCNIGDTDRIPEFDLMYSKMVMEHVGNACAAYENIYHKLNDGGICLSFHPTLFALPFVINLIIPEALSRKILSLAFPNRVVEESKFPAQYSWCFASRRNARKIKKLGYSDVVIIPFFGHGYYSSIPVLRSVEKLWRSLTRRFSTTSLASYAYTIVQR